MSMLKPFSTLVTGMILGYFLVPIVLKRVPGIGG